MMKAGMGLRRIRLCAKLDSFGKKVQHRRIKVSLTRRELASGILFVYDNRTRR